jgi:hypothetical protein
MAWFATRREETIVAYFLRPCTRRWEMIKRNKISVCAISLGIMWIFFLTPSIPPLTMPSHSAEIHDAMTSRKFRDGVFEVQQNNARAAWSDKPQKIDALSLANLDWFQKALSIVKKQIEAQKEIEAEQGLKANDGNWLDTLCQKAAVGPKSDHSDISIDLINLKPEPDNLRATLVEFKNRTLEELHQELTPDVQAFQNSYASAYIQTQATGDSLENLASISYVRKLEVPPQTKICCIGDIHGSIGALARNMWIWQQLGLVDKELRVAQNVYFVFLGDYVDYGKNNVFVLYTLLKFKLRNWNSVILLKGNHETASLGIDFLGNMQSLYGDQEAYKLFIQCFANCFTLLPFALYVGNGSAGQPFIQCCHGGIEPGYNPKELLQSHIHYQSLESLLKQHVFCDAYFVNNLVDVDSHQLQGNTPNPASELTDPEKERLSWLRFNLNKVPLQYENLTSKDYWLKYPSCSGFLWSDFVADKGFGLNTYRNGGFFAGQKVTNEISHMYNVCAYIRGHQHHLGIKIGAIEYGNEETARWFDVLNIKIKKPKNVAIIPQTSFSLKFTAQAAQAAFTQALSDKGWDKFEQQLPHFALSDQKFGNNVPIVTLTTASEAQRFDERLNKIRGVINKFDTFCICTVNDNIKQSKIAIYEARAVLQKSTKQQAIQKVATQHNESAQIIKEIETDIATLSVEDLQQEKTFDECIKEFDLWIDCRYAFMLMQQRLCELNKQAKNPQPELDVKTELVSNYIKFLEKQLADTQSTLKKNPEKAAGFYSYIESHLTGIALKASEQEKKKISELQDNLAVLKNLIPIPDRPQQ